MSPKQAKYILSNDELYINSELEKMTSLEWEEFIKEISNANFHKISLPLLKKTAKTKILLNMIAEKPITQITLSHVKQCPSLGGLNYQWVNTTNIPTDEFQLFLDLLAITQNTLTSMKFSKQEFHQLALSGLTALQNAFVPLKLQSLSFINCNLGDMASEKCQALITIFKDMKTLKSLKLPANHLHQWTKTNLILLIQAIHALSLKYLDLKNNELCDKNSFGYEFFNLTTKKINAMDCFNFSTNGVENLFAFEKKQDSQELKFLTDSLAQLPLGCLFIMNDESFISELSPSLSFQPFFWACRTLQADVTASQSHQNVNYLSKFTLYSTNDANRKAAKHMLLIAVFLYFLYQGGHRRSYDIDEIKGYFKTDKSQDSESFKQLERSNSIHLIKKMVARHHSAKNSLVCSRQYSTSAPFDTIMQIIHYLCTPEQATSIYYTLNRLELGQTGLPFFKQETEDMCFQRTSSEMIAKKNVFAL